MTSQQTSPRLLEAGVARVVITPPVGIRMMGYTVQRDVSRSIERDLTATALVLSDGELKTVLIACDLLFIQSPHVERIREQIGARLGIPGSHVLINCSHTHLGPMLPGWHSDTPEQTRIQQRYLDTLEESLAGVAAMADTDRRPARIAAGTGHAPIGINRREKLSDGNVVIGENPDGPVDHDVNVIRIDDIDGLPIAVVMTAAAHTVVLGPKTLLLSPDYVGPAREIVESATGALTLFLQGAAGNVNPCCSIGAGGEEQYDDLERVGAMLGGEALKTWAQLRTHNRHGPRRLVQSVAAISVWDYETTPEACIESFAVDSRTLTLPLANLPDRQVAEDQLNEYRGRLDKVVRNQGDAGALHVASRLVSWAERVLEAIDSGEDPPKRNLEIWALRINDIGLVAVSAEPFAEIGLEVKRRSKLAHTLFLGYSNGCLGYIPTPEAFAEGGMEVYESYQNYLLPAPFTQRWAPATIDASLELLSSLG